MSKREISSTLKNLKFMQRGSQKEEKPINNNKEAEVSPAGYFTSTSSVVKRCVVIVEGDPLPGAARGRMSFLSSNPSIDKLNGEESEPYQNESSAGKQNETVSSRENGPANDDMDNLDANSLSNEANGDLKRKQADVELEPSFSNKSMKGSKNSSPSSSRSSEKQHKCEKLDWNVLRPPKYPSKTR